MKLTAWRLVQAKYSATAFSGEGARQFGGRWNRKGTALVYAASSLSLAALELLVHLESYQVLQAYMAISAEFDERLCQWLDTEHLPPDWANFPAPESTKSIGADWIQQSQSAVLAVPSILVPIEMNFLVNPQHPDFARLKVSEARAFQYDRRLVKLPA